MYPFTRTSLLLSLCLLALSLHAAQLRDVIGVSHIGGAYNFNGPWPVPTGDTAPRDYLNEGADEILNMGSRVIKVHMHPAQAAWYWYTANPGFNNVITQPVEQRLTLLAQDPHYVKLFQKPFTSYIINVMANVPVSNGAGGENYQKFGTYASVLDGMTATEKDQEKNAIKNLAIYLLQTYRNTGKTFVIANGEGDWIMREGLNGTEPDGTRIQAMRDWINVRQAAVTEARQAVGSVGVQVVHSAEVNFVMNAMNNVGVTMTNDVLPYTNCDLYSYTNWDIGPGHSPALLHDALDYIASKVPDSTLYGSRNVMIGEYGSAENGDEFGDGEAQKEITRRMTEVGLGWGCPYIVYWQVYCNEMMSGQAPTYDVRPTNAQMRGLWLVHPDGTRAPVYAYFEGLMSQSVVHVNLKTYLGYYVMANDAGGGLIYVNAPIPQQWEYLSVIDRNGGSLASGDSIFILTQNGHYFMAWDNGGGAVDATSEHGLAWETFTILKQNGTGSIVNNDTVAIQAGAGHYFVAEEGGGGSNVLNANRTSIGPWEQFGFLVQP